MNDKQKQVEGMAYSICTANRKLIKSCRECPIFQGYKYPCVKKEFAEKFYNAGCRMQSDTAREIKEKIFEKGQFFFSKVVSKDIYEVSFTMTLDEFNKIVAQYGVEVEGGIV